MVLRGWLNKENKIRSLLRILFFFYASKCSNQSLWHFARKGTGLPSGGPKGDGLTKNEQSAGLLRMPSIFHFVKLLKAKAGLWQFSENKKCRFFKRHFLLSLLRGQDSNLRPLGYEPNELPLLHPAIYPAKIVINDLSAKKTKI